MTCYDCGKEVRTFSEVVLHWGHKLSGTAGDLARLAEGYGLGETRTAHFMPPEATEQSAVASISPAYGIATVKRGDV